MSYRVNHYTCDDELCSLHQQLLRVVEDARRGVDLPQHWRCEQIYAGRNALYAVQTAQGQHYVVKCFGSLGLLRRLYYSYLGRSKAQRSYLNALELIGRDCQTPAPLGYAEYRSSLGLLGASYYTCAYMQADEYHIHPHMRGWSAPDGFVPALAYFLADLHLSGVEHLDLSPGNILYRRDELGEYQFYLVDVNRMNFLPRVLSLREAAHNLARLASNRSVSTMLARYYAEARGWDLDQVASAINQACDAFWLGRLPKLSARLAKRSQGVGRLHFLLLYLSYLACRMLGTCLRGKLRAKMYRREEMLYRHYLAEEDIRHALRRRRGYSYTLY